MRCSACLTNVGISATKFVSVFYRGANAAVIDKDLPAIRNAFVAIEKMAPPGYDRWASISRDGGDAKAG